MTEYEKEQYAQIKKWEGKEPSVVDKVTGAVLKPLSMLINVVVPKKAIEGALTCADAVAKFLTDTNDVKRDSNVQNISELKTKDLELSDKLANNVHNWALGIAGTEGGGTGTAGLLGMAVDIPFIITLALRTIHKIGVCYGYEINSSNADAEKAFVMGIMSVSGANTMDEKNTALLTLKQVYTLIQKNTWKRLGQQTVNKGAQAFLAKGVLEVKALAGRLGVNLTKRKALQAVPVLGGAVGAAMNISFINDVAWAARRAYQRRWLLDNGKLINDR